MAASVESYDGGKAPKRLSPDRVLIAIGDVHGHADLLAALQDHLAERIARQHAGKTVSVIWLGDFIDRGPQPGQALKLAASGLGLAGLEEVALKGNHEAFLLSVIESPDPDLNDILLWRWNGGEETIQGLLGMAGPQDPVALSKALRRALGESSLNFLHGLALYHRIEDYLFVHAGIHPSRALSLQGEDELLWIREPFLNPPHWIHEFTVVHGHTPERPVVLDHRIGIDSGVYMTGTLTAVEIVDQSVTFFRAKDL